MQQRATVIKGSGAEWLHNAILANLIDSEAMHMYDLALDENTRLKRRNERLEREKAVLEGRLTGYQDVHRAALDGRMRRWRLWMWDKPVLVQGFWIGAAAGAVAVTLVYEIARWCAG